MVEPGLLGVGSADPLCECNARFMLGRCCICFRLHSGLERLSLSGMGSMKKKPKTIPCCVGVVTVTTVVQSSPSVKTFYKGSYGFASADMTPQRRKSIAENTKASVKEYVLKNRDAYGIKSLADVKFYAGVKILECDGLTGFRNGTDK